MSARTVRGRTLRARTLRALAALVLGLGSTLVVLLGGTSPAYAAACTGRTGVTVITDFKQLGGGVQGTCLADGGGRKAAPLFEQAGFEQRYATRQPGFVCRVDEKPASDPCVNTSPADAYWSLWWSDGDRGSTWVYSSLGVQSLTVPDGGLVAWSWDQVPGNVPPNADPERPASGQPAPSPAPSPSPTPPATGGGSSSGGGTSAGSPTGGGSGSGGGSDRGRDGGGSDGPGQAGGSGSPAESGSDSPDSSGSSGSGTSPDPDDPTASASPSAQPSPSGEPDEDDPSGRDRSGRGGDREDRSDRRPGAAPTDDPTDSAGATPTDPADPDVSEFPELVEPDAAPASSEAAPAGDGGLPSWVPLTAILALFVAAGAAALARRRSSASR